jgi:hypothetical protein
LTVPGEDLAGMHSAADLVGNVALDIGRVLLSDPDSLAGTDSAEAGLRNRPPADEVRRHR